MKSKILPIILLLLVILNGFLIFMLIKKPHQKAQHPQERNFLINELRFSENQKNTFIELDSNHRSKMEGFDHQIKKNKDYLFNAFSDATINIDSMSLVIGKLEAKKEVEVFGFFKKVREICTKKQQLKFDKIIAKAIKGIGNIPPKGAGNHPPRNGEMRPPPR